MAANFPLDIVLRAIDRVSAPLRGVAARLQALGARVAAVRGRFAAFGETAGINRLGGALGNVGNAAGGFGSSIGSAAAKVAGLAAAAGIGVAGLVSLGSAFADATGAIGDAAERTGITRERFQELSFAAVLGGSSAETLEGALTKMNVAVSKAKTGSKELKEMFKGLGISLKKSNGEAKSTDELFDTMVDRISKIKDPTLQAKAAMTVFGKSAVELLPMMRDGKAGLGEMADEARRLGVVIGDDAVREGEAFGDLMDTLALAFKGVGNTVASAIIPQLNKLGAVLIEAIVKYRPQIEKFAKAFADNLPENIERVKNFFIKLREEMQPMIDKIDWLAEKVGGFNLVMGLLAAIILGPVVASFAMLMASLAQLGVVLLTTPVGWFLLAIAAIAGAVYMIYDSWDGIVEWFTAKWDGIKEAFRSGIVDGLVKTWTEFNPVTLMLEAFAGVVKYLTGWDLGKILKEKMTSAIAALTGAIPDWAKEMLGIDGTVAVTTNNVQQSVPPGQDAGVAGAGPAASTVGQRAADIGQQSATVANGQQSVAVTVDLKGAPQGTRVTTEGSPGAKFDTNIGYAQAAPR